MSQTISNKIGSYATIVDVDDWMNEKVPQKAIMKPKKTRVQKQIINKIFADCALIIQDQFWIDKFNMMSYGKFPNKFSYRSNILSYKKGNRYNTIQVSENPYEAICACMEFLKINGGIFSQMDEQTALELQYTRQSNRIVEKEPIIWSKLNKKMQMIFISFYVLEMKEKMGLNKDELEQLRQTINLGIYNKLLVETNIILSNEQIVTINDLFFDSEERLFFLNPNLKASITRTYSRKKQNIIETKDKDTIPQFNVKFRKYLEIIDKKVSKRTGKDSIIITGDDDEDYEDQTDDASSYYDEASV